MSDPEEVSRFLRAWDAHRAARSHEDDPTHDEPEEVRQAIEMGDRLARSDFSGDSRVRESLRKRLLDSPQLARPQERGWGHRAFSGARWAMVALVLVVALAWSIQTLLPGSILPPQSASQGDAPGLLAGQSEATQQAAEEAVAEAPAALPEEGAPGDVLATLTPQPQALAEFTPVSGLPAFSEAGRLGRLAYIASGAIWTASVPEGNARRLTESGEFREPRWSSTGEWLAYREGENRIWLANRRSSGYLLEASGEIGEFAWSPAGQRLAYIAEGELRIANIDSGGVDVQVLEAPEGVGQIRRPAWSPDGGWLAFDTLKPAGVWKIPARSGEGAALLYSGEATLRGWTGDGAFLVFWQGAEGGDAPVIDGAPLALIPESGGEPVAMRNSVLLHEDTVDLTGDGLGWLALASGGGRETWTNKGLSVIGPLDARGLAPADHAVSSPAWSPDAGKLAYSAVPDADHVWGGPAALDALQGRHLWIVEVPSGTPLQLTHEGAFRDEYPQWSWDGATLLFVRVDAQGRASLWQMDAAGGDPFMLAFGLSPQDLGQDAEGDYGHIAWYDLIDWWQPEQ